MCEFNKKDIIYRLEKLGDDELDALDFGVIGFDKDTLIRRYNSREQELSGYNREHILGKALFSEVASCMNNHRVAHKFLKEDEIDEVLPYLLSLKVRPVRVQLRLLKHPSSILSYVLIKR